MQSTLQLSIFVENKPGTLAAICEALTKAKINIYGMTISDTVDHSVIRLVLSDPRKALNLFEERGVLVVENDVIVIENANKPGAMASVARKLEKAKVNIEYAYLATHPKAKTGLAIMRVSDTKKGLKALGKK